MLEAEEIKNKIWNDLLALRAKFLLADRVTCINQSGKVEIVPLDPPMVVKINLGAMRMDWEPNRTSDESKYIYWPEYPISIFDKRPEFDKKDPVSVHGQRYDTDGSSYQNPLRLASDWVSKQYEDIKALPNRLRVSYGPMIVGSFVRMRLDRGTQSSGMEEEHDRVRFDATRSVLAMSLKEIQALQDRRPSTDILAPPDLKPLMGPKRGGTDIEVVDSILEFFGVDNLQEITLKSLNAARAERGMAVDPVMPKAKKATKVPAP